uniref:BBSome complex member BBS5 PH domain-containing protein n=1 Tax=Tetradesmus obliquus TaxID=3088 RepID=A0A383W0W7_TETOB|eukprot:jgi/Sobl393_1/7977/SZX71141.1
MDGPSLAEALFGKKADEVWQDREVRFDVAPAQLQCRRGEEVLENFDPVEDTKGNNGEAGRLTLTNLRLTWRSSKQARTSITMGLDAISSLAVRPVSSRLKGKRRRSSMAASFLQVLKLPLAVNCCEGTEAVLLRGSCA